MTEDLVPSKEQFAHIISIVNPPPTLEEWEKNHEEMVARLEGKYGKPFREIVKECGLSREPRFPEPPRSD